MSNIQIELEARSISSCVNSSLPLALARAFEHGILQHQNDLYEAAKTHDIILDLAQTGTGKTKAGLSILDLNRGKNAIYIAPTNALITQQTQAATEFVEKAGLPHIVKSASAKDIKGWRNDLVGDRSGEKLYNVLREPATIFPECGGGKPLLLVTNPDIFYYATFFLYQKLDRSNIASVFYNSFSTVIFDEFHLYDAKQLVSLCFYLALSKEFGFFEHNRKIVLLTATPEPACEQALKILAQSGVKIAHIDGESQSKLLTPSQTAVGLEIFKQPEDRELLVTNIADKIIENLHKYPSLNGAVILDSKDLIGRISDRLRAKGLENICGRITGDTPLEQRHTAAQKQVILATSTVDIGFNFDRDVNSDRQNLDWLIFSARDRFSFWQRIGRVGKVLGKQHTNIPSTAIAYIPEQSWTQGIEKLDCNGGRLALRQILESLECMNRPFLEIYWKSEAFLEIARPLLELETSLVNLPAESLVSNLYQTLQQLFGGKREWDYYRRRIKILVSAEDIARRTIPKIQKEWQYIKHNHNFLMSFLKANCPEDFEDIKANRKLLRDIEAKVKSDPEIAGYVHEYARILKSSYAPLFKFRDSLFESIQVYDPHNLILDEVGKTNLDPIHLLRFLEFVTDGDRVEIVARAEKPYNLSFSLWVEDLTEFKNTQLCKLYAFESCTIKRMSGDTVRSTQLPEALNIAISKNLMPGVIVNETAKNRWAIIKLQKQGLESYRLDVYSPNSSSPKQFTFFPSLSGILAIASAGIALKCPDEEDFWVV